MPERHFKDGRRVTWLVLKRLCFYMSKLKIKGILVSQFTTPLNWTHYINDLQTQSCSRPLATMKISGGSRQCCTHNHASFFALGDLNNQSFSLFQHFPVLLFRNMRPCKHVPVGPMLAFCRHSGLGPAHTKPKQAQCGLAQARPTALGSPQALCGQATLKREKECKSFVNEWNPVEFFL